MKNALVVFFGCVIIALLVIGYLKIGTRATTEASDVLNRSQGQVEDARKGVDRLNQSTRETEKALEQVTGN